MDPLSSGTAEPVVAERAAGTLFASPLAAGLAGLGLIAALAAEVLPWVSFDDASRPAPLSVDNLSTLSVLGYYLAFLGLLAATGTVLTAPVRVRRAAAGAALGFAGALAMVLAGMSRWIFSTGTFSSSNQDGQLTTVSMRSGGLGPGLYLAVGALILLVAATVTVVRPGRTTGAREVRPRPARGRRPAVEPVAEPLDLSVSAAPPVDQRLFVRPDSGPDPY